MAELVSIRSSDGKRENAVVEKEIAVENPAYSSAFDVALATSVTNGDAKSSANINASKLKGTTISFHNVKYTVDVKVKRKKIEKEIVKGISGIFPPGMNAILGPTGCGKTTTLDMLADRKDMSHVTGDIMVNGTKKPSNFKRMTGYVVQHDVVMALLTVRENIYFSASLRLPSSMSSEEKAQKVDKLIDELGLSKVADTKVGNEVVRGISGGEKRRTMIGMELITSPHVLFLDEPTTGLDASTASSVMQLLHDLSRKGNTIIFSIHQPRYSIFKLFDYVCLLGDGHVMYNGPAHEALDYFQEIGYECEAHNNPPDFFLDVINSVKLESSDDAEESQNEMEKGTVTVLDLAQKFKESRHGQAIESQVSAIYNKMKANPDADVAINNKFEQLDHFATGWFKQLCIVGQRSVRSLIRNPLTTVVQFFVMAFLGLVVGALYFQIEKDANGIQNRVGCFFFIIMNMVYSNLDSIELLLKEKPIFVHESASGYYRVSVYFLAKIFGEFLPYRALSAFLFACIAYWMAGFDSDAGKFFIFVLTLIQVSACGCSFAFLLSATFGIFAVANLMVAVLYTIMLVFGGLLLNQESFGDWIGWLRYLSIFKYGLECLQINELDGMEFDCPANVTGSVRGVPCIDGSAYLDSQGIDADFLWWNQLILFAMSFVCCFLTYVQLRRVKKDK